MAILSAASLVLAASAVALPREVVRDYEDNGVVDRCYSDADFAGALEIVRADQEQYGAAASVIQEKQAACQETIAEGPATPAEAEDDDGVPLLLIIVGVVVVAAVAAVVLLGLRRRGPGDA